MNVIEDLKAYVDGELSPERKVELDAAMERDERLRREMEEIRVLSRLIGDCVMQPEPVGLDETLASLARARPRAFWARPLRDPARYAWLGAIGLFVLIAIAMPLVGRIAPQDQVAMSEAAGASTATPSAPAAEIAKSPAAKAESEFQNSRSNGTPATDPSVQAPGKARFGDAGEARPPARGKDRFLDYGVGGGMATGRAPSAPAPTIESNTAMRPLLVRTAELTLVVTDVSTAEDGAARAVKSLGGYIEQSSRTADASSQPQATMTLRVPEPKFESLRRTLSGLGKVLAEAVSGQDVTAQVADTEARLKVMRAEELSYVGMLSKSRSVDDTLAIRERLDNVRQEIESLDAQRKTLRNQASYSTITLTLQQAAKVSPPPAKPTWFDEAWTGATERASGLGRWLAEVGMNLLLLAPIWVPVAVALWWYGRKRRLR